MNSRLKVLLHTVLVSGAAFLFFNAYSKSVPYSIVFNRTESIPLGIYWSEDIRAQELKLGDLACFPYETPVWAKDRKYLPEGLSVCKPIAGFPGDKVIREGDKLFAQRAGEAKPVLIAQYAKHDSRKRPLPQDALKTGTVPEGMLLMVAGAHLLSLDSRYVGYIPARNIQRRIHPIYTW